MTGSTAGHDRDLRWPSIGAKVEDFVLGVESNIWIRIRYAPAGRVDELGRIVDEMFGW